MKHLFTFFLLLLILALVLDVPAWVWILFNWVFRRGPKSQAAQTTKRGSI